jgi:hypothetical protein
MGENFKPERMEPKTIRGELTADDITFIQENHTRMTFTAMAHTLKRVPKKVKDYMDANGIQRTAPPPQPDSHPFRRANVSLKRFLDAQKQGGKVGTAK